MPVLDEFAQKKADYFKQKRSEGLGQVAAQGQEQQDAIQRKFASMGAQGSGAQFDIQKQANEAQAAQARQVQNDITGQEIAAQEPDLARRFQAEQTKLGQEYASSERQGTQQFQAGQQAAQNFFASSEAAIGRKFTADENASIQKFNAGESQASRDLQRQLADSDQALKKSMFDMQNAKDEKSYQLAKQQFDVDLETTNFNKFLSSIMAGIPYEDARKLISKGAQGVAAAGQEGAPSLNEEVFGPKGTSEAAEAEKKAEFEKKYPGYNYAFYKNTSVEPDIYG